MTDSIAEQMEVYVVLVTDPLDGVMVGGVFFNRQDAADEADAVEGSRIRTAYLHGKPEGS